MSRSLPSADLIAAAVQDAAVLERVVDQCAPVVLGWCKRLSGPTVDPEDAAHDVLVVVVERLDGLRSPQAFPAWLFQITRKTLASRRRRAWIGRWIGSPEAFDTRPDPEEHHQRADRARRIQALLDRIPDKQRQVLVLHDLEERSDAETAAILGVSRGTVKSRLRVGRQRLRELALEEELWPPALQIVQQGES